MVRGDGHDRAAAPGSWQTFLCVGPGWASASNSPFRRQKVWVNEGGVSTPLIVHWPKGIAARGEVRRDVGHVIDFAPTVLDLAGGNAELPAGAPPLPGKSLAPAFARDGAVTREFVFFNHEGNRSLRMGDWKIVSAREDADVWELFDLGTDRCERVNLAARHPEKLKAMVEFWTRREEEFRRQAGPVEGPAARRVKGAKRK
jgi:arylsulfatase